MKLKVDIDILNFLKSVQTCQGDVLLKTSEGDILNLNSTLSQYIFITTVSNQKLLLSGTIECMNSTDISTLKEYLIAP